MIEIPTGLLENPGPGLIIFLLCVVVGIVGRWWRDTEAKLDTSQESRSTEARLAADALFEQRIVNERSLNKVNLLEYQRDTAIRDTEKCDRELDRWRSGTQGSGQST